MGRKRISDTSIFNNLAKKQDELDQSTYKRTKYTNQIEPMVQEIKALCNRYGIPCFMAFATDNKDGFFNLKTVSLIPEMYGLDTSKDRRFADFVNIQNGFVAVPRDSNAGLIGITDEFIPPNVDMDNDEDEESIT